MFPLYLTHLIQLLDVVCFQPFKHYYGKAINNAYRTSAADINKMEFLSLLPGIRKQTFKKGTIKSAFEKTGLYPWNPKKVLSQLATSTTPPPPSTPPTRSPIYQHKPISMDSIKKLYKWLSDNRNTDVPEQMFQYSLTQYMDSSVAYLEAYQGLEKHLKDVTAANKRREKLKREARKSVQKYSTLTVAQGRKKAVRRRLEDVKKIATLAKKEAKKQQQQ